MSDIWTAEEIDLLISLVKSNECIYNTSLPAYSNRGIVYKVWDDIASHFVDKPARECNRKWNVLRAGFRRVRKEPQSRKKKWVYYEPLSFLEAFTKSVYYPSNADSAASTSEFLASPSQQSEITENNTILLKEEDINGEIHCVNNDIEFDESWCRESNSTEIDYKNTVTIRKSGGNKSSMALFLESVLIDTESIPEDKHSSFKMDILQVVQKYQNMQKNDSN